MKNYFIFQLICLLISSSAFNFNLLSKEIPCEFLKQKMYQPILINNKIVQEGRLIHCDKRYKIIKPILEQYNPQRTINVLDIGAAQGYFSLRIANDFNAIITLIEGGVTNCSSADVLKKILELNTVHKNTIMLNKYLTLNDLKNILFEHFDIVIAFNVLHHMAVQSPQSQWKELFDTALMLGENVIIELPTYAPSKLLSYFFSEEGKMIGKYRRSKNAWGYIKWFKKSKKTVNNPFFPKNYEIRSNFNEKKLVKLNSAGDIVSSQDIKPGISLYTFKHLNGVWPEKNVLQQLLNQLKIQPMSIFLPSEIIIQGIKLIINKQQVELKAIPFNDGKKQSIFPFKEQSIEKINEILQKKNFIEVKY